MAMPVSPATEKTSQHHTYHPPRDDTTIARPSGDFTGTGILSSHCRDTSFSLYERQIRSERSQNDDRVFSHPSDAGKYKNIEYSKSPLVCVPTAEQEFNGKFEAVDSRAASEDSRYWSAIESPESVDANIFPVTEIPDVNLQSSEGGTESFSCCDDTEDTLTTQQLQEYPADFNGRAHLQYAADEKNPPTEVNVTVTVDSRSYSGELFSDNESHFTTGQDGNLSENPAEKYSERALTGCSDSDIKYSDAALHSQDLESEMHAVHQVSLKNKIMLLAEDTLQWRYGVFSHGAVCFILATGKHTWYENCKYLYGTGTWNEGQTHSQTTKIVLYVIRKGRKHTKCMKICTIVIQSRSNNPQQEVFEETYEERFTEMPHFVDVTQPGRISDVASDPPGQQSSYIRPGDNRREAYRLSTFENFPRSAPVNIADLAKHGFSYTGFDDRVKCYSCGRTADKWERGDIPAERRWHKPNCPIFLGQASDNVPIGGIFAQTFNASRFSSVSHAAGISENFNGPTVNFPRDIGDRVSRGSTYHMQPGSGLSIGVNASPLPTGRSASQPVVSGWNPPRQWRMANVNSPDHRRYLTNLYLNRELDRLASFCRWPSGRPNVTPVSLARAGFFYLGDMDRTQCFSCAIVLRNWTPNDDAMDEHRTHFANCSFVLGTETRNVCVPERQETPQELSVAYPCRYPSNPHMRSEATRAETFDRRWPLNRIRASVAEIAEAGFFFLGERDRVKCWYCNGGLQNWEYEDSPWIEHAKWFPNCQFLLRRQGQLFVYRHLSLSPNLPRPIIGKQEGSTMDPVEPGSIQRGYDIPPMANGARARPHSPPPMIIDPQEETRKRKERVEKEIKENSNVKMVIEMGYQEHIVRRVLEEQLESGPAVDDDNIFGGMISLLDAVQGREAEIKKELEEEQATSVKRLQQPFDLNFSSHSTSYSVAEASPMETGMAPSLASEVSGVVSGFESDDEEMDLYSGVTKGAVGSTKVQVPSAEATTSHLLVNIPDDPKSVMDMLEQKQEERLCKICFTEEADMVFIPCSHMCCCKSCTEAIRQCPLCRTKIEKAIKTYSK